MTQTGRKQLQKIHLIKFIFFKDLFIYFRERECEQEGQMERERESQGDSLLSAEPDTGLELPILRS